MNSTESIPVQSERKRLPGLPSVVSVFGYFVGRYPGRTFVAILCLVLSGVAEGVSIMLFMPLLQRLTAGDMAAGGRVGDWVFALFDVFGVVPTLPMLLALIVAGFALKGVLFWAAMSKVGGTVSSVTTDLRLDLLRAMMRARWSYFSNQPAGQFANAIASEALKASGAYLSAAYILACAVQLAVYSSLAFLLSWQTALAGLGAGLLFVGLMHRLILVSRRTGKQQVTLLKSVTGRIVDMLHGLKPIRAMARESALVEYLETEAEALNSAQRTEVRAAAAVAAAQEPMMATVMALGLYVVTSWNLMPFSALLVLALLFSRLFNQVNLIVQHYQRFVSYESAYFSIRGRIVEAEARRESVSGSPPPCPLQRGISLRGVVFRYGDQVILNGVTLELPARSWTALIGPSGAGKTTLLDLIAGLQTPQGGEILLDDQPLSETSLDQWRRCIGYVPQEMLLLNGSVFSNVTLGEPDLTPTDVENALRATGAWEFVAAMPQGMDTPVGERGARLSGGQRQRIALARALVRKPELLILDEATASLDPETERALCETWAHLSRTTTILAISHQPAVAQAADRVFEVRNGVVVPVLKDEGAA